MVPLSRHALTVLLFASAMLCARAVFAAGAEVQLQALWTKGKEHWLVRIQPAQPGFAIASNSPAFNNKDFVRAIDAATGQPVEFKIRRPTAIRTVRFVEIAFPQLQRPINLSLIAHGFVIVDQRGRSLAYNERFAVRAPPALAGENTPARPTFTPQPYSYSTDSFSPAPTPGHGDERHGFRAEPAGSPQPTPVVVGGGAAPPEPTPRENEIVSSEGPGEPNEGPRAPETTEIKQFPFPPPLASALDEVPRELLVRGKDQPRLKDISEALKSAFTDRDYGKASFYAVPDGFAMASQLEQINADGSAAANRWLDETPPMAGFSIKSYLSALFRAREGYYRVIVFVVTNHPFRQTDERVSSKDAGKWAGGGLNQLPREIGDREYTDDYACTALIYEFETLGGGDARFVEPSEITGRIHLEKSGLLAALARNR